MRLYLDTNILIYLMTNRDSLSNDVYSELLDYSNSMFTSSVCVHELIHLYHIEKLKLPKYIKDIVTWIDEQGISVVSVKESHLSFFERMPLVGDHRDPNDRLIIAQAIVDKATLVSSDRKFAGYRKYGLDLMFNER